MCIRDSAVAADLSWPARQSRGVKYLSDSTVLGSRERSPVLSFRCGHNHRTKGELMIFFVNYTGGCGDISLLIPLASMNVSMRFFMLRHKISH